MKIKVKLTGRVMCCNGSMHVKIFDGQQQLYHGQDLAEGPINIDLIIDWPAQLQIFLSNKNKNDTIVDASGDVIKDKAIEITGLSINNFPVQSHLLDKIFLCQRQGYNEITNENWWGFNGQVNIIFDRPNPMAYMLSLTNQFDMTRLDWNSDE